MQVFWNLWHRWSMCPYCVAKRDLHWNDLVDKGKSGYFCQDAKFRSTPSAIDCGEKLLKILSEFDLVDLDNPSWTWWRLGGRYEMLKSTVQFNQVSIFLWLDTAKERDGHLVEVVHWEQWSKHLRSVSSRWTLFMNMEDTREQGVSLLRGGQDQGVEIRTGVAQSR